MVMVMTVLIVVMLMFPVRMPCMSMVVVMLSVRVGLTSMLMIMMMTALMRLMVVLIMMVVMFMPAMTMFIVMVFVLILAMTMLIMMVMLMMVMTATGTVRPVVMVMRLMLVLLKHFLHQLRLQILCSLDRLQDRIAFQRIPRCSDDSRSGIMLTDKRHAGSQFLLVQLIRPA